MNTINLVERAMTQEEYARIIEGFHEHAVEHGNPPDTSDRFGFVALDGDQVVGCSSGLVHKTHDGYNAWCYLTDLFVEKPHRHQGIGATLLRQLEERVATLGVRNLYTYTGGHEAPGFYQKQGYEIFIEMEDWYSSGDSKFGLKKVLST